MGDDSRRVWRVRKAERFSGETVAPPDKSISHRGVLFAALAVGRTRIDDFLVAEDTLASVRFARAIGADVSVVSGPEAGQGSALAPGSGAAAVVESPGITGLRAPKGPVDCGNSGTTMRLGAGIAAGIDGPTILTGDASLSSRPMGRVVEPLRAMGGRIGGAGGDAHAPLEIRGGGLRAADIRLTVASAQVKSAVLLAGLFADGRTSVTEPGPSRDHTERLLRYLGVEVESSGLTASVVGGSRPVARDIKVAGDVSSAAFMLAAAAIVEGAEVTVRGVGLNPTRTGFLDVLRAFGADVEVAEEGDVSGEPVGAVTVRAKPLRGVSVGGDLVVRAIDEFPLVAVLATQAEGRTLVADAAELRVKETDRIATICGRLAAMGARIEALPDGFAVDGPTPLEGAALDSASDHRIAMALAVAGLVARGETTIAGAEAAEVSFPGFARLVAALSDGALVEDPTP